MLLNRGFAIDSVKNFTVEKGGDTSQFTLTFLTSYLNSKNLSDFCLRDFEFVFVEKNEKEMTDTIEMKVILVGNSNVGKTCIVQQGVKGEFRNDSVPTLGAAYSSKIITIGQRSVNLQIWDTAGQEKYRGMAPMYYRGGKVALVCYAINDKASFKGINSWINDLKENADPSVIIFIVANKCDLEEQREVEAEEALDLANQINAQFYEVSAKTGQNIDTLFQDIVKVYLESIDKFSKANSIDIAPGKGKKKSKGCC